MSLTPAQIKKLAALAKLPTDYVWIEPHYLYAGTIIVTHWSGVNYTVYTIDP
ncbi:MAG: hypothetical protein H0U18_08030 [Pyrinomonadaceae bacterium]|nr:hypothetical protein [Pyrinomonadaceae bacterium]